MSSNGEIQSRDVEEQLSEVPPEDGPAPSKEEALPELTGKTVEHIEVVRQDPQVFGDVLYVYFTDGTLKLGAGMSDLYGLLKWEVT